MKLTEKKNVEGLEAFGELTEYIAVIASDKEIMQIGRENGLLGVSKALKKYANEMVHILALYYCIPLEEFDLTVPEMLKLAVELIKDKDIIELFQSLQ